jgi:hypothetical protein
MLIISDTIERNAAGRSRTSSKAFLDSEGHNKQFEPGELLYHSPIARPLSGRRMVQFHHEAKHKVLRSCRPLKGATWFSTPDATSQAQP